MTVAKARPHAPGMEATTKQQKAGRRFLLQLVAEYGPVEAATILRRLADEIEELALASVLSGKSVQQPPN